MHRNDREIPHWVSQDTGSDVGSRQRWIRRFRMKKLLIAAAIAAPLALSLSSVGPLDGPDVASAKITTKCENRGGQEPKGNCNGKALEKTRVNPAGKAPPGQN
jgi:hypothetical protein